MSSRAGHLRREIDELALVAAGAIPGALLRWQLEGLAAASSSGLKGLMSGDLVANLMGCLLLGALTAGPHPRARLMLWGGIGFCGSLTTFSSWLLELVRCLDQGAMQSSLRLLVLPLVGGLIAVALGRAMAERWLSREGTPAERPGGPGNR